MHKGLTRAGLGAVEGPRHLIELAGRSGFQSVDLDAKSLLDLYGLEESLRILEENRVSIGSIALPVEWRGTEDKFLEGFQDLASHAAAAKALGCARCCTYILPSTDEPAASFMAAAIRRLRLCAVVLGAYGIRLGLEFVGPHHLRTRWSHPFIWTMKDTLDLIDSIGECNVGLLLDSYHWHTTGLGADDIESLGKERIVHVHLNDAPAVPVEEALDNGRLYPGEGVIDLAAFLKALRNIGYDGPITQEVLSASPPSGTPEELAERSKLAFDRVFEGAGMESA
ncbi:sugar phosphate isomerase/epimerase family protein [Paenibacillus sp. GCM10027627]|uniref:sugar phosphate isomerase/epimerase family protein n=1 Tax=unclassified Paenibacillus TaxID=185978 RepID=UPI0036424740